MLGAIYGDIIGSIAEKIPRLPPRTKMTPTDDSFLTCACKDWIEFLTEKECSEFLVGGKNKDLLDREAAKSLKKWWSYFPEQGFSRSFNTWAKDVIPGKEFKRGNRNTNGCIMRNSPIVPAMLAKSFYIRSDIVTIAQTFAGVTHMHQDSMDAVALHTEMIFLSTMNELSKATLKSLLLSSDNPNFICKPLSFWREAMENEFIWDAPRSLSIAVSAILEADSFKEAMDNCVSVGGDTDTYAAIAGPIAEKMWGIDTETHELCLPILKDFPRIKALYKLP